jgi:hypothetical protein
MGPGPERGRRSGQDPLHGRDPLQGDYLTWGKRTSLSVARSFGVAKGCWLLVHLQLLPRLLVVGPAAASKKKAPPVWEGPDGDQLKLGEGRRIKNFGSKVPDRNL